MQKSRTRLLQQPLNPASKAKIEVMGAQILVCLLRQTLGEKGSSAEIVLAGVVIARRGEINEAAEVAGES